MSKTLAQVIAVEKGIKTKVLIDVDIIYKALQKPVLFDGFIKTYKKIAEEDEDKPAQKQRVQISASKALSDVASRLSELFDVTAQKDWGNTQAKADVEVDGTLLVKDAPAPYLLFLEKQLTDLHTLVGKVPTLDPAEEWSFSAGLGLFKSAITQTTSTAKVQKALVLYPHSDKHPAQTQLITQDVVVGTWDTQKFSGAIEDTKKRSILARIEKLQHAVKFAREKANTVVVSDVAPGAAIFGWLLR